MKKMFKLYTHNIGSVNGSASGENKDIIKYFLENVSKVNPDIIFFQELLNFELLSEILPEFKIFGRANLGIVIKKDLFEDEEVIQIDHYYFDVNRIFCLEVKDKKTKNLMKLICVHSPRSFILNGLKNYNKIKFNLFCNDIFRNKIQLGSKDPYMIILAGDFNTSVDSSTNGLNMSKNYFLKNVLGKTTYNGAKIDGIYCKLENEIVEKYEQINVDPNLRDVFDHIPVCFDVYLTKTKILNFVEAIKVDGEYLAIHRTSLTNHPHFFTKYSSKKYVKDVRRIQEVDEKEVRELSFDRKKEGKPDENKKKEFLLTKKKRNVDEKDLVRVLRFHTKKIYVMIHHGSNKGKYYFSPDGKRIYLKNDFKDDDKIEVHSSLVEEYSFYKKFDLVD